MKKKSIPAVFTVALLSLLSYSSLQARGGKLYSKKYSPKYDQKSSKQYNQALFLLWTKVYKDHGKTLYCDQSFSTKSRKARAKSNINAEHVFPMSWVTKDLRCGTRKQCQKESAEFRAIESDLHNIYPANQRVNKARSNYRFGEISGEKRQFGQCDFEIDKRHRIAEPTPVKHGEIARAMLYMHYQYHLSLPKKTQQRLWDWDKKDPPNAEEKRREKIIAKNQGKVNPFITRHPFNP